MLAIAELTDMPIARALKVVSTWELTEREAQIAARVLDEIRHRMEYLSAVGLDYLSLSRGSATLSGGEAQRIRLATQIGSKLRGVLYVLDEPSIGLHPRDNDRLLATLAGFAIWAIRCWSSSTMQTPSCTPTMSSISDRAPEGWAAVWSAQERRSEIQSNPTR